MAKSVASKRKTSTRSARANAPAIAREIDQDEAARRGGEITGLFLLAIAVALFLALMSFVPADIAAQGDGPVQNLIGPVGAYTADILLYIFGVGSFFFVGVVFVLGGFMLVGRRPELKPSEFVGYGLFVFAGAVICHLFFAGQLVLGHSAGGLVGDLLGKLFTNLVGDVGTYLFAGATATLALMLVTDMSIGNMARWLGMQFSDMFEGVGVRYEAHREFRRQLKAMREQERLEASLDDEDDLDPEALASLDGLDSEARKQALVEARAQAKLNQYRKRQQAKARTRAAKAEEAAARSAAKAAAKAKTARGEAAAEPETPSAAVAAAPVAAAAVPVAAAAAAAASAPAGRAKEPQIVEPEAQRRARELRKNLDRVPATAPAAKGDFKLPPLSFLNYEDQGESTVDHAKLREMAGLLEQALENFGVQGEIVEICPGPVITMFEFSPAPGIKLSKIANLADDLAMALSALSVRIIAPIPGKGVVGIEVPNEGRETVYLKEILAHDAFQGSKARMPMGLGKATDGNAVATDLAKMPHLLVAGATGSGKSVAVNTMIVSLLFKFTPEELRLIMIDPKMLEFSIYEGIPHLLLPVVTDPKRASVALQWAVEEMEKRYRLLADMGVRNVTTYNSRVKALTEQAEADLAAGETESEAVRKLELSASGETRFVKLPYIVCIIDEFADLMMVASKDVETAVARLAQKARAAGIHLILATQRPSVDVITGLIKANFPTRIALRVAQRTDSRTILDSNGAENLLGRGDMLFLPPGTSQQQRVHGAFVSEDEIEKIVAFLKEQGEPQYDPSILTFGSGEGDEDGPGGGDDEVDEHYDRAIEIVTRARQASISMLQRKLRVGYNRAARLVERMEADGIVGPSDGARPREVLAPPPPEA